MIANKTLSPKNAQSAKTSALSNGAIIVVLVALSSLVTLSSTHNGIQLIECSYETEHLASDIDIEISKQTCNCSFPTRWTAQSGQDKFVYEKVFFKEDICCKGTFVEFGARNGIEHSNTYPYEKFFGWNGLMFEIDPREVKNTVKNRPGSKIINGPVCPSNQISVSLLLSSLGGWSGTVGNYEPTRVSRKRETVQNVTCYHLATELQAMGMKHVDYMTIDTEGTEQLIIEDFPWYDFDIRVVQIEQLHEHRYPAQRGKKDAIIQHMTKMNYTLLSVYVVARLDTDDLIFIKN